VGAAKNGKWKYTALHQFNGKDGYWVNGVIIDGKGNLFGTRGSGGSRKPASARSDITLRRVAGLRPSRFDRASVREPTGSPVAINVSTMAVRISRSRSPMGAAGDIKHSVILVVSKVSRALQLQLGAINQRS